jgi:hypothetical protein
MKLPKFIFAFLSIILSAGCGVYNTISVNSAASTDFTSYTTFAWLQDEADTANSPYNNEIVRNNLKNYFGRSLVERGLTANLSEPDLLLQISISNKKREIQLHSKRFYFCKYYYGSEYYAPYPFNCYYYDHDACYPTDCSAEKINYVEGAITLKVFDRKQNKLVWSATAKGDIYDPALINKSIHPAVVNIMKKFPLKPLPKPKKTKIKSEIADKRIES